MKPHCRFSAHDVWRARLDNNTNANRIHAASTPEDWRNPPGFLRITWLKTVLEELGAVDIVGCE